jgi:esterase/lipase
MKGKSHYPIDWYDINIPHYNNTVNMFRTFTNFLQLHSKLHATNEQIHNGDIFLFNHFSRFETVIPQFLIHEKTGDYGCMIASGEFFEEGSKLGKYLSDIGVFPHDHPRLFSILAGHIFRGIKVFIFPEGGMVKDKQVIDDNGKYNTFSRSTGLRRKHHTGAAVLAQGIDVFKATVLMAHKKEKYNLLEQWKNELKLDDINQLITVASKPTTIVPANITFYPIRATENLLQKTIQLFNGNMNTRIKEELLVEGNIMFKNTDMDVRLGEPVNYNNCDWCNNFMLNLLSSEELTLDEIFQLHNNPKNFKQLVMGKILTKHAGEQRDQYMKDIYDNVTINLNHIASSLVILYLRRGITSIEKEQFHITLYTIIKQIQHHKNIYLHRSLLNPYEYTGLTKGMCKRFVDFVEMGTTNNLIIEDEESYHFLPKILEPCDFDNVRKENLIVVYYNEAKPIHEIAQIIRRTIVEYPHLTNADFANWQLDNEQFALSMEQLKYRIPKFDKINQLETATANPEPFLLTPKTPNGFGILLVHGLLASPAEVREYGEMLCDTGFIVMGPRLSGHGTSPHALQKRTRVDWYTSVEIGFEILKQKCNNIILIGFSSGGTLLLKLATEQHPEIKAIAAVAVPVKLVDNNIKMIPILYHVNNIINKISGLHGIKTFIRNIPEHPYINYCNIPIKCLYELRQLINEMTKILPKITIPVLLIYADNDPIISIESANVVLNNINSNNKKLEIINAGNHGILKNNTNGTWNIISKFLNHIEVSLTTNT